MPQRNVATNFTFEQQRNEINLLAADFWTQKGTVDTAASTYLKNDGSNNFTGQTLAVPNAFTINANSGGGTVTIAGNLDVTGTTTTVSSANLEVTDKNILISKGSTTDAQADGAGITIDSGTDITWNFVNANDAWVSSIGVESTTFLKATTFLEAARGQFTGATSPTAGSGVEINAPDGNTGQIIAYNRGTSVYNELRLRAASVPIYTGTTNAIVATFNSNGLTMESGKTITGTASGNAVLTGSTNNTIATVTGANALTGEANLTFNGSGDLTVKGDDGISANLYLIGHAGDTNGDGWRVGSNQDDKDLTIANNESGSYVDKITILKEGNVGINQAPDDNGGLVQIKNTMVYTDGTTNLETSASKAALRIRTSSDSSKSLFIGGIDESATPYLQVGNKGTNGATASYPLILNPYGGEVLIGDSTASLLGDRVLQIGKTDRTATYVELRTATNGVGGIVFSDGTAADNTGYRGTIEYAHGGTNSDSLFFKTAAEERLRITSEGDVSISGDGTVHGVSKLTILPANRTDAFDASDGDTWHDVVLKQTGDAQSNAVGIAFEISTSSYHKNAGTGIAAVKNGTAGDYGTDLVFITRGQSTAATEKLRITGGDASTPGHVLPGADNTQDLGSTTKRWANVYTGDLNLCNEGSYNEVDGTSGSWTMQEGDSDLFLINRKSGKKYKFNLTEVS